MFVNAESVLVWLCCCLGVVGDGSFGKLPVLLLLRLLLVLSRVFIIVLLLLLLWLRYGCCDAFARSFEVAHIGGNP